MCVYIVSGIVHGQIKGLKSRKTLIVFKLYLKISLEVNAIEYIHIFILLDVNYIHENSRT
jgi:hypothetical protein